ncbi:DUF6118 family protein [Rhizobium sp. R693]|uniref:DUF6118 family protein n=1 Tax=Rhizobium sp. R693 TaxID=1764276 RepID=UPI001675A4A5|nr:DUF6118 family protein [Rhizobium sp. R693]
MSGQGDGYETEDERDAGDPAQAFDALRRTVEKLVREVGGEMTVIRKGVEAVFETFETFQQPSDYGPDLGRIVKQLQTVAEHLEAVEKSPALRNGADHYARAIEAAGSRVSDNVGRMIETRGRELQHVSAVLEGYIKSARDRRTQDWGMLGTAVAGLMLGVLLTLFAPRLLPGSVDISVASTVMNADRWNAGIALMQSKDPRDWQNLVDASNLVRANQEALAACAEAAARAKNDQRCTISVSGGGGEEVTGVYYDRLSLTHSPLTTVRQASRSAP